MLKNAMKKPKAKSIGQIAPKAAKNKEYDDLGNEYARIHMEKQDFDKLELTRQKALKRRIPDKEEVAAKMQKLRETQIAPQ